jgi:peroxiredoxin
MRVGQRIPDALATAELRDASGNPRVLAATWQERDVVVVFVRHFGCIGCAEQIDALRPRLAELGRLDVDVVVIGSGEVDQLVAFIERERLALPFVHGFVDRTLASYRATGLVRSRWAAIGPRALSQAFRAWLRGHRGGAVQGDVLQQGGVVYVRRGGEVAFYHRSIALGDHAPLAEVVDVALVARALEAS